MLTAKCELHWATGPQSERQTHEIADNGTDIHMFFSVHERNPFHSPVQNPIVGACVGFGSIHALDLFLFICFVAIRNFRIVHVKEKAEV